MPDLSALPSCTGSTGKISPSAFILSTRFAAQSRPNIRVRKSKQGGSRLAEKTIASGGYVTDTKRIRKNYAEWPNAMVIQGGVPEILPEVPVDRVAFLHLDMNCAYPERAALEFFWTRLTPGAVVLFDDYSYCGSEYQAESIDAATAKFGVSVLSLPTGQGLVIKP